MVADVDEVGVTIMAIEDYAEPGSPDGGMAGYDINGGSRDVVGNLFAGGALGAAVGLVALR